MSHGLQLILLVTIVVAAAKLAGAMAARVHQPSVFGEILAGVVLGPSLLNILGWPIFADGNHALIGLVEDLSQLGVLLDRKSVV